MINKDKVKLNESSTLDVLVYDKDDNIFSGTLRLNHKEEITLDISSERKFHFERSPDGEIKYLRCKDIENQKDILLISLKEEKKRQTSASIDLIFFNSSYSVKYMVYGSSSRLYTTIYIYSKTINDWIGPTKKQYEPNQKYKNGNSIFNKDSIPVEFLIQTKKLEEYSFSYKIKGYDGPLKTGFELEPVFCLNFTEHTDIESIIEKIFDIFNLFIFITEKDLELEKIELLDTDSYLHEPSCFYYINNKDVLYRKINGNYCFFPFGHDLYPKHFKLKYDFPKESIKTFFDLDRDKKDIFNKFIYCKKFSNIEETFKGYFRIIENTIHNEISYFEDDKAFNDEIDKLKISLLNKFKEKKDDIKKYIKRARRLNNQKKSPEVSIRKFVSEEITIELKEKWEIGDHQCFIKKIQTLRNDMIHGNNYEKEGYDIEKMTAFIEVIIVIKLLSLLNIDKEIIEEIIPRLWNYDKIRKRT